MLELVSKMLPEPPEAARCWGLEQQTLGQWELCEVSADSEDSGGKPRRWFTLDELEAQNMVELFGPGTFRLIWATAQGRKVLGRSAIFEIRAATGEDGGWELPQPEDLESSKDYFPLWVFERVYSRCQLDAGQFLELLKSQQEVHLATLRQLHQLTTERLEALHKRERDALDERIRDLLEGLRDDETGEPIVPPDVAAKGVAGLLQMLLQSPVTGEIAKLLLSRVVGEQVPTIETPPPPPDASTS